MCVSKELIKNVNKTIISRKSKNCTKNRNKLLGPVKHIQVKMKTSKKLKSTVGHTEVERWCNWMFVWIR